MIDKRGAKVASAVSTGIAEIGIPSSDIFVGDLDRTFDGHSSAKATLSRGFARDRDKNVFKQDVAHCNAVE